MLKIALFILCCLFFSASSCSSHNDDGNNSPINEEVELGIQESSPQEIDFDNVEEQKLEIFKVEKKSVIFFSISKREAQNIAKEIGESYKWETEALFTGFINQSKTFGDILRKHNINSSLCNNKQFEIKLKNGKVVNFDRIKEDQILGVILANGEKEPLIRFGMYNNMELAELIQDYFGIKNIGYVPSDSLGLKIEKAPNLDSIGIENRTE